MDEVPKIPEFFQEAGHAQTSMKSIALNSVAIPFTLHHPVAIVENFVLSG
jgi:hypothetical protein